MQWFIRAFFSCNGFQHTRRWVEEIDILWPSGIDDGGGCARIPRGL